MKKITVALTLAVFIVGLVAASQTRSDLTPARSYTMTIKHIINNADGSVTNLGGRRVYANANGELRQTPFDPNKEENPNNEFPVLARTKDGLFTKTPGASERKEISSTPIPQKMQECFRSTTCLRGISSFVRIESIAGLEVYVLRSEMPDQNPIQWIERGYSPQVGYNAVKTVRHMRDGSEDILEATSVQFEDVPADLNDDIKAMPTKKQ